MAIAPVDLIVRSRRILTPGGYLDGAIAVRDEKIVALLPADEPVQAARTIDVGGKTVIPGLVDSHAHFRDPGFTHKEDFETGSRAAAAGGVTTILDMCNVEPPTNTVERFLAHIENAKKKAIVDFGHNCAGTIPENIAALNEAGVTSFKLFMIADIGRSYPHMPGIAVDNHAQLYRICEEVAKTGKVLMVHPFDQQIYDLFVKRAQAQWGMDFRSYARVFAMGDYVIMDSGIATLLQLQRATGVRLDILHMSTVGAFEMVRAAKAQGRKVYAEVNPPALFLINKWENIERLGPYALSRWIPEHHGKAIWEGVLDGTADIIGTDHAPHTREEKEQGWTNMYKTPGGATSIQDYLPLFLNEVNAGRISLERVVDICSTRPARIFGLYPRKGVIQVGSDADITIFDPEKEVTITADNLHSKAGYCLCTVSVFMGCSWVSAVVKVYTVNTIVFDHI